MKSYWYATKSKLKPKNRGLISVVIRKNYNVIELAVEADKDICHKFGLKYLGCGEFNAREIQILLLRYQKSCYI